MRILKNQTGWGNAILVETGTTSNGKPIVARTSSGNVMWWADEEQAEAWIAAQSTKPETAPATVQYQRQQPARKRTK